MKLNIVKDQKQDVLPCQNRTILSNGELKQDFRDIIRNVPKADEYISSRTVNKALNSDIYSRMNLSTVLNNKMPISKYSNNGVLTLTDKNLIFTPYEESEKGWSRSVFNQKEYEMILDKMEEDNSLKMGEDFWEKSMEDKLVHRNKQDAGTNSNIVVNADGSRSLVITMKIGGGETTMCIEISKPTEFPNSKANAPEEGNLKNDDLNVEQNLGDIIDNTVS